MSRSVRIALGTGAVLGLTFALFACASTLDRAQDTPTTTSEASPQPDGADPGVDAGAPGDAADEFLVPDGAVVCGTGPCAVSLTGTGSTFCALLQTGRIACWGNGDQGQLGYDPGPTFPPASPTARLVDGVTGVTSVSVGEGNACARTSDGGVYCWGAPELVNAGITPVDGAAPFDAPVITPTRQDAVAAAASVAVGTHDACTLAAGGALSCWGHNQSLELGRGATDLPFAAPGAVSTNGQSVALVRPGSTRTFAITTTGALLSWGTSTQFGSYGFLLGRDTSEDPDGVPAAVPLPAAVRAVATGPTHACAIAGRLVHCWGSNESGQLGRGSFDGLFFPPGPTNLAYVVAAEDEDAGSLDTGDIPTQVAVGDGHSCAVMASGRVYCWGANGARQLGGDLAITVARSGTPQRIRGLSAPAVHLASGSGAICALLKTGAVECWGSNYLGELGAGAIDDQPHPQPAGVHFPP